MSYRVRSLGRVTVLCCLLAGLAGCRVGDDPQDGMSRALKPEPIPVYVVLPVEYSRYLDSGLVFDSAGAPEDLPVYSTVEDAAKAVREFEAVADRATAMWSVYKLDAEWHEDVVPQRGEYHLKHPARIVAALETDG